LEMRRTREIAKKNSGAVSKDVPNDIVTSFSGLFQAPDRTGRTGRIGMDMSEVGG
jgi:hypothetical protein